jgi:NDP-sugar pyrophosphorylase family protein
MAELIGLIPAAGMGSRAHPYTQDVPKPMLEINGMPNLQKNIEIMRDDLGIREIYIVIGYLGNVIREYFKDGSDHGVKLTYIENPAIDKGLAYSILLAKQHISTHFCVILSDECYINSNHKELATFPYKNALATCALMHVDDEAQIHRNYSCEIEEDCIVRLIEKPKAISNDILGCGTFILAPHFFNYLDEAFQQSPNGYVEFITLLDTLCRQGEKVLYFDLKGSYVNINDRDSLELAKYHERQKNFGANSVRLLIYSEGEEKNIAFSINRYKKISAIDSIHVILPFKNTISQIVEACDVSIVTCPPDKKLYGEKIKFALEQVSGDILIITEASYSFPGRDIDKLLAYLTEADMVIGTRTTRQLIEQGSEMQGVVRISNILLAKFIEILWWNLDCRFSDVGCTFRAIWKTTFDNIKDHLTAKGPEFSAEMMIEVLGSKGRIIEIPVNYFNRSAAMYQKYRNFKTFVRLFLLIIRKRISS